MAAPIPPTPLPTPRPDRLAGAMAVVGTFPCFGRDAVARQEAPLPRGAYRGVFRRMHDIRPPRRPTAEALAPLVGAILAARQQDAA